MNLVFATNNKHKIEEAAFALKNKIGIVTLEKIGFKEDIPENEPTIKGNALAKARYIFERYGIGCFADDTGLEVESLDGKPGVFSARYAGENCSFQDNIDKLLKKLGNNQNRKAAFITVIALIIEGREHTFEGRIEGTITSTSSGKDGFGYDPIFKPNGFEITFAEMTLEQKNQISHRGLALKQFSEFIFNM